VAGERGQLPLLNFGFKKLFLVENLFLKKLRQKSLYYKENNLRAKF